MRMMIAKTAACESVDCRPRSKRPVVLISSSEKPPWGQWVER